MSSLKRCKTLDEAPIDSEAQGAEMALKADTRTRVVNTNAYPHCSIAFMQMTYPNEDGDEEFPLEFSGFF